jgi:hypothetical protein
VGQLLLLDEDFTAGIPPEWNPRLLPKGWYYRGDRVTWGRYDFDIGEALEEWALSRYEGAGSQNWTDYRVEATVRAHWHIKYRGSLVGVWFRNAWWQGGQPKGYVVALRPRENRVHLGYVDPNASGLTIIWPKWVEYKNDHGEWYNVAVEVRGANIKVWIKKPDQVNWKQLFDWTDPNATWGQGPVSLGVYRGAGHFDDIKVWELY